MFDTAVFVTKIVSTTLTGVFGVYGLVVEFKDEHGRITKPGRNALCLIVGTALLAATTQGLEFANERHSAHLDVQNNQRTLREISRALQPLRDLRFSYALTLEMNSEGVVGDFEVYVDTVKAVLGASQLRTDPDVISVWTQVGRTPYAQALKKGENSWTRVGFAESEALIPSQTLRTVLFATSVEFSVYQDAIAAKDHPKVGPTSKKVPSWSLKLGLDPFLPRPDATYTLTMHLAEKKIRLVGQNIPISYVDWKNDGAIVAIPDLDGTQAFLNLANPYEVIFGSDFSGFELETFRLLFPDGRELELSMSRFEKQETRFRGKLYSVGRLQIPEVTR